MGDLTDADLDALAEAVAKMTPGPWRTAQPNRDGDVHVLAPDGTQFYPESEPLFWNAGTGPDWSNAAGIVALRNAAPALLAEVRRLRAALTAARLDATTCRAVAVEAIGMIEHLDRRERRCRKVDLDIEYNKGRIGSPGDEDDCDCAISTLRARLTSPDPAPVRAAIDALDEAAYDHGEKILGGHDEFRAARDGRRAARADLLRLLGLEAP